MSVVLCVPDLHFPWADKQALKEVYRAIRREKPNVVIQLGDLYDQYVFSRYDRDMNLITPEDEVKLAKKQATEFWAEVHKIVPRARKIQLIGNHDVRVRKRVMEKLPELATILDVKGMLYTWPHVEVLPSDKDSVEIDGVVYTHGWMTKLGDHMKYFGKSVVHGHSHKPGLCYAPTKNGFHFEMDVGFLADEKSTPLSYTSSKHSKWLKAYGVVEDGMPRLVIL